MNVKYKKLNENAQEPERAYEHAAAWDVYATSKDIVNTTEYGYIEYGIGLAFEIPVNYVIKIFPRSSISKTGLIQTNCVGIVDPDYRGEVTIRYKYIPNTKQYDVGDKIGQIRLEKNIPVKWIQSDTLSETKRGAGGYGSSDNKN